MLHNPRCMIDMICYTIPVWQTDVHNYKEHDWYDMLQGAWLIWYVTRSMIDMICYKVHDWYDMLHNYKEHDWYDMLHNYKVHDWYDMLQFNVHDWYDMLHNYKVHDWYDMLHNPGMTKRISNTSWYWSYEPFAWNRPSQLFIHISIIAP